MTALWLPLCGALNPFVRMIPPLDRWRLRAQLSRWVRQVRSVDEKHTARDDGAEAEFDLAWLSRLEARLSQLVPPPSLRDEVSRLRVHLAFVVDRLCKKVRGDHRLPRRAA